ncbi:hypothetical protein NUU61_006971 [Penicillium alfredii]|uniref:Zn(2)-C6 fungal-type domain-containing protein n=1 Tax=Penicillium alfredii TaxID=1506179 RepID=A0A9W9K4A3_9EURO|nr:uncharacterized protein NUU61_006971 [Penicillium alfredii]KAJ5092101.1 hypothetical protein NUU61_006971 [Penicillium alfredii]
MASPAIEKSPSIRSDDFWSILCLNFSHNATVMDVFSIGAPSPSPKKNRSRQSGTPWTRSGCLTCKKRRKGCDKAKPSCKNCINIGRTCEGYGSMWVEPLSPSAQVFQPAGELKRRRLSATHLSQTVSPLSSGEIWPETQPSPGWSIVPSPSSKEAEIGTRSIKVADEPEYCQAIHPEEPMAVVPRLRGSISHLSKHETHYLQYHMEQGSRLLANLESADNPLRSFLIPRAMVSPLLMKAVCAVSALHLANRSHGLDAHTAAASYYGRTLTGLQTALIECRTDWFPDDAMLAVGLLCKYEIVRGSVTQWGVHLQALQRLIVSRGGFGAMDRETGDFLRGLFVYAYHMAQISNRKFIASPDVSVFDNDIGNPRLDIYIGYTEHILKLCARIAELPSMVDDSIALRLLVASINESLLTWSHTTTRYTIPHQMTKATLTRLQLVAECFREAAFIYLHSILERMYPNHSLADNTVDSSLENTVHPAFTYISLISTPKSTAVHRCLARVESFHLDGHCEYSALTFPLFIAGCESDSAAQRDLVARSLDTLHRNFGIGNVRRAKEVLGILWSRNEVHAGAESGTVQGAVHWLDVLDELGWELNLA